jgi:hypothetical protein
MSIKQDLETYSSLEEKKKLLRKEIKELVSQQNIVAERIKEYMKVHEEEGLVYGNKKFYFHNSNVAKRLSKAEKREMLLSVLAKNQVARAQEILQELEPPKVAKTTLKYA